MELEKLAMSSKKYLDLDISGHILPPSLPEPGTAEMARLIVYLKRKLVSSIPEDREDAAIFIGQIGSEGKICIPLLISLIDDKDGDVQIAAIHSLSAFGDQAEAAIPRLLRIIEAGNNEIRCWALSAIGYIGIVNDMTRETLCRALNDPSLEIREGAAWAIRDLNDDHPRVIKQLSALWRLDDSGLACLETLASLSSVEAKYAIKQAQEKLMTVITEEVDENRLCLSLSALSCLGTNVSDSVTSLTPLLKHSSDLVREEVIYTLCSISATSDTVLEHLVSSIYQETDIIRALIAELAGDLGGELANSIIQGLRNDIVPEVRKVAEEAYCKLNQSDMRC